MSPQERAALARAGLHYCGQLSNVVYVDDERAAVELNALLDGLELPDGYALVLPGGRA